MGFQSIIERVRLMSTYLADVCASRCLVWLGSKRNCDDVVKDRDSESFTRKLDQFVEHPSPSSPVPRPPPPAQLTVIGRLSREKFHLTPEGNWREGKPVATTMAYAIVEDPILPQLQGHFSAAMSALSSLSTGYFVAHGKGKRAPPTKEVEWVTDGDTFKVAHNLCMPYPNPDKRHLTTAAHTNHRSAYIIEEWPVSDPRMRAELSKIAQTHYIAPIQAYDQFGDRIPPEEYEEKLRGAVVCMTFTLKHWYDGKHHFTANIQRIKVLLPPVV